MSSEDIRLNWALGMVDSLLDKIDGAENEIIALRKKLKSGDVKFLGKLPTKPTKRRPRASPVRR